MSTSNIDLWGPARVPSLDGAVYFLTCDDDFTRKVHLHLRKRKSDTCDENTAIYRAVERQLATTIKTMKSENEGELSSRHWQQYMQQHGIQHVQVPPGAQIHNGRAERLYLTSCNGVRTILVQSGLLICYGGRLRTTLPILETVLRMSQGRKFLRTNGLTEQLKSNICNRLAARLSIAYTLNPTSSHHATRRYPCWISRVNACCHPHADGQPESSEDQNSQIASLPRSIPNSVHLQE